MIENKSQKNLDITLEVIAFTFRNSIILKVYK